MCNGATARHSMAAHTGRLPERACVRRAGHTRRRFHRRSYTTSTDGDVTGYQVNWDVWLVKLDEDGALRWQKTLGGSMDEIAYAVATTNDGGYILAGYTASTDGDVVGTHVLEDMWVVKVDDVGTIECKDMRTGHVAQHPRDDIADDGRHVDVGALIK